jgi:spermidine synthase
MGLIIFACFFLSGASGLVFEMIWTRELGLIFGSTTLAIATVLSAFMGGLALGSHLGGRFAARLRDPLAAYALCEAGIGLYALSIPFSLAAYPHLNAFLFRALGNHHVALSLLRFSATAALLLLPTTLMGATLPLLSQFLVRHKSARTVAGAAVHIGALFALNTTGAVAGTFLSGFVLLPLIGISKTNAAAALVNLSLATAVLLARRRLAAAPDPAPDVPDAPDAADAAAPGAAEPLAAPTTFMRRAAVLAYAVSGGVAMVYQVLWTRALAIVLGSSVYSFTLILLAFLIGLAAGAALTTRLLPRLRRPVLALALCHLLTLLCAVASYLTIDKLPAVFLFFLRGGTFTVDGLIATQFLLCALAILPATLAMGGVMPLTMRVYTSSSESVARDVGAAYALNTIGAITGSFAAGFVILPTLGLQRGLLLCAALTCALFALLAAASERRRAGAALAAAGALATLIFIVKIPPWNLQHFSAGLFRIAIAGDIIRNQKWPVPKLLYYKDGVSTTVSVEQWQKSIALKNNGKVDASNSDDMATQIMVGLMPLLFHPGALDHPPSALVIGFGSGVTIGAVTQFPIARADVVELEPAVVEAGARFFAPYNHEPTKDPRVRVIMEDGRNFLTQSSAPEDRYDVIVSEPSNPWITGVSSLFTVDYWRLARRRLKDDGVFCQWAQLYEMSQENIKTLLRSFTAVFPYTYAFSAEHLSSDVLLLASPRPLPLSLPRLRRNFDGARHPLLRAELARAGVQSAEDLLADLLLVPADFPALTAGAALNTDDNARIEFAAPRDLLGFLRHDPYVRRVYGAQWPYGHLRPYLEGLGSPLSGDGERGRSYARLARALLAHGKGPRALRLLPLARAYGGGEDVVHVERLLRVFEWDRPSARGATPPPAAEEVPLTPGAPPWDPLGVMALDGPKELPELSAADRARMHRDYADALVEAQARRYAHALQALKSWPGRWIDEGGADLELLVGFLLYKTELVDDAVDRLRPLAEDPDYVARRPALLYYLARAEYENAMPRQAVAHLARYLSVAPPPIAPMVPRPHP